MTGMPEPTDAAGPRRPEPVGVRLVPAALLDPVVAYFNPRRVIVFGSVARGEAGPDSDIDLLVIVDDDTPAEKVTLRAGFEARRSYRRAATLSRFLRRLFSGICGSQGRCCPRRLDGIVVHDRG